MGKIRIKTLGEDELEARQKKRDEARRAKKRELKGKEPVKIQNTLSAQAGKFKIQNETKTDKPKQEVADKKKGSVKTEEKTTAVEKTKTKPAKKKTADKIKKAPHSKRYVSTKTLVNRTKTYPYVEGIALVVKTSTTAFTASIEAHFNLNKLAKAFGLKSNKDLHLSVEKKFPLVHAVLGKADEKPEELQKKFESIVKVINPANITKCTLSSSMGPGVKVEVKE